MFRETKSDGVFRRHRTRWAAGLTAVLVASSVGFGGVSASPPAPAVPVVAATDTYTATVLQAGADCPVSNVFNTLGFVTTHAVTTTSNQATFRYELVGDGTGSGEYVHPTAVEITYTAANGILRSAYRKFTGIDTAALGANPRIRLTVTDDNGPQTPVETAVTLRSAAEAYVGSGTTAAPYQVSTVEQLRYIECMPKERQYVLTTDLDLAGKGMVPVGVDRNDRMRLRFDGDGHTISNLKIDLPGIEYVGLFARLEASSVRDLTLANPEVHGNTRVGALVGYTEARSAYSRITVTNATISGTADRVGLVVGESRSDDWTDVVADGTLDITSTNTGDRNAGGLMGWGVATVVRNATVDAAITGTVPSARNIGGVMGRVERVDVSGIDATSTISLTGDDLERVGGIFGDRIGESSVVASARVTTDITLTARAGVGNFRVSKVGGVAGQTGTSTLADSVVTGNVTIVTAPATGIDVIEWIGGYVGRVVDDRPRLMRSWIDVDVTIGADPTNTKAAKLIGALGGEVTELAAVDVLVTGNVTVAGKAETTGGLIGEPKDDRVEPRTMLRNVLWSGTRSVGEEMTSTRSVLWGKVGFDPNRLSSVAYSEGVLWDSTVNTETLTESLVGAPATAAQLSDTTFMEAAGYDTDTVWCIRPDELPTLRVLDPQACSVPVVPTTPAAPSATQAVETVTLTVTPPDSTPAITSYDYSVSDDNGETWTKWMALTPATAPATATTESFTVSGLEWCTTYLFKVRANNSAGAGPESPASAPVTLTLPAPEPPTNVTGAARKGSVRLTWTAPPLASVPGSDACTYARYDIRRSTNGGTTWSSWTPTRSTATTFTVTGLSSSTTYVFQVRSVNKTGSSNPSNTSNPVRPLR